ncbi:hypothetical protein VOLCADRAFT_107659 [Volvox carteri f. nagariensis]|uniref:DUF1664 domain-containing protein n=1 Tax=Volvox carteri f. nagariensis TaxID=3068 RepID=D8UFG2_VOLCA|nr:uncharacterized protein VOLCADRAFT_107659 [Volvox carteri f. nagariensis]EFJ41497.1 hypothetical protein VOLCADRAFT_107659 [Volvox carteri f. nagariensis]|eukprot:XP_002957442.1 hypothetical protein VOLCADRAFT_107659 [Volvox carteri f. nagariensis]
MPSWPTALGGMLFAGYAATQAHKVGIDSPTSLVATALKTLNHENGPSSSGRVSGSSELSVLQGEVDRLHKLLSDVVRGQKSNGYTVIHTGRGGWSVYILPAAVVGGVVYLYVRIRGVSISDFFMVTNKSLQSFRELVSQSMTQLWEELRKQKDEFIKRIATVGEQQQAMMAQQTQMDEKLLTVSEKVEEIRGISDSIDTRVCQMDNSIKHMSTGVQRANEGIYLLCAAVAEVTRRVGMDNSRLKSYVQATPPEITDGNPGLRTLLEGFGSGEQLIGGPPALSPAPSGAASSTRGVAITEVSEVGEGGELEVVLEGGAAGSRGAVNASKASSAGDGLHVLYRRNSAASMSARSGGGGSGLLGSIWSSQSANFSGFGGPQLLELASAQQRAPAAATELRPWRSQTTEVRRFTLRAKQARRPVSATAAAAAAAGLHCPHPPRPPNPAKRTSTSGEHMYPCASHTGELGAVLPYDASRRGSVVLLLDLVDLNASQPRNAAAATAAAAVVPSWRQQSHQAPVAGQPSGGDGGDGGNGGGGGHYQPPELVLERLQQQPPESSEWGQRHRGEFRGAAERVRGGVWADPGNSTAEAPLSVAAPSYLPIVHLYIPPPSGQLPSELPLTRRPSPVLLEPLRSASREHQQRRHGAPSQSADGGGGGGGGRVSEVAADGGPAVAAAFKTQSSGGSGSAACEAYRYGGLTGGGDGSYDSSSTQADSRQRQRHMQLTSNVRFPVPADAGGGGGGGSGGRARERLLRGIRVLSTLMRRGVELGASHTQVVPCNAGGGKCGGGCSGSSNGGVGGADGSCRSGSQPPTAQRLSGEEACTATPEQQRQQLLLVEALRSLYDEYGCPDGGGGGGGGAASAQRVASHAGCAKDCAVSRQPGCGQRRASRGGDEDAHPGYRRRRRLEGPMCWQELGSDGLAADVATPPIAGSSLSKAASMPYASMSYSQTVCGSTAAAAEAEAEAEAAELSYVTCGTGGLGFGFGGAGGGGSDSVRHRQRSTSSRRQRRSKHMRSMVSSSVCPYDVFWSGEVMDTRGLDLYGVVAQGHGNGNDMYGISWTATNTTAAAATAAAAAASPLALAEGETTGGLNEALFFERTGDVDAGDGDGAPDKSGDVSPRCEVVPYNPLLLQRVSSSIIERAAVMCAAAAATTTPSDQRLELEAAAAVGITGGADVVYGRPTGPYAAACHNDTDRDSIRPPGLYRGPYEAISATTLPPPAPPPPSPLLTSRPPSVANFAPDEAPLPAAAAAAAAAAGGATGSSLQYDMGSGGNVWFGGALYACLPAVSWYDTTLVSELLQSRTTATSTLLDSGVRDGDTAAGVGVGADLPAQTLAPLPADALHDLGLWLQYISCVPMPPLGPSPPPTAVLPLPMPPLPLHPRPHDFISAAATAASQQPTGGGDGAAASRRGGEDVAQLLPLRYDAVPSAREVARQRRRESGGGGSEHPHRHFDSAATMYGVGVSGSDAPLPPLLPPPSPPQPAPSSSAPAAPSPPPPPQQRQQPLSLNRHITRRASVAAAAAGGGPDPTGSSAHNLAAVLPRATATVRASAEAPLGFFTFSNTFPDILAPLPLPLPPPPPLPYTGFSGNGPHDGILPLSSVVPPQSAVGPAARPRRNISFSTPVGLVSDTALAPPPAAMTAAGTMTSRDGSVAVLESGGAAVPLVLRTSASSAGGAGEYGTFLGPRTTAEFEHLLMGSLSPPPPPLGFLAAATPGTVSGPVPSARTATATTAAATAAASLPAHVSSSRPVSSATVAASAAAAAAAATAVSAAAGSRLHAFHDSAVDITVPVLPGSVDLAALVSELQRRPEYGQRMQDMAAGLLAWLCQAGRPVAAGTVLGGLVRHRGMRFIDVCTEVRQLPEYGGMSLLHLAVNSGSRAMLSAMAEWAQSYGSPLAWDEPSAAGVTPAHLAAALAVTRGSEIAGNATSPGNSGANGGGGLAVDESGLRTLTWLLQRFPAARGTFFTALDAYGSTPGAILSYQLASLAPDAANAVRAALQPLLGPWEIWATPPPPQQQPPEIPSVTAPSSPTRGSVDTPLNRNREWGIMGWRIGRRTVDVRNGNVRDGVGTAALSTDLVRRLVAVVRQTMIAIVQPDGQPLVVVPGNQMGPEEAAAALVLLMLVVAAVLLLFVMVVMMVLGPVMVMSSGRVVDVGGGAGAGAGVRWSP